MLFSRPFEIKHFFLPFSLLQQQDKSKVLNFESSGGDNDKAPEPLGIISEIDSVQLIGSQEERMNHFLTRSHLSPASLGACDSE